MKWRKGAHGYLVAARRVERLGRALAEALPRGARVLDVGCGDGRVCRRLTELRPDLDVEGLEVVRRPDAEVPIRLFDGRTLPLGDGAVDAVVFVDVLHHAEDPGGLLREAVRVARRSILVKDHFADPPFAVWRLRWMDRFGNPPELAAARYLRRRCWLELFREIGLEVETLRERLDLYPPPADWIFGRGLHFLASLRVPVRG